MYTDVCVSMGFEHESTKRAPIFRPFQVNEQLMSKAHANAVFMHCLPARRNAEVTDAVLDGPQSIVFDQAENRMHAQKALLLLLLGGLANAEIQLVMPATGFQLDPWDRGQKHLEVVRSPWPRRWSP